MSDDHKLNWVPKGGSQGVSRGGVWERSVPWKSCLEAGRRKDNDERVNLGKRQGAMVVVTEQTSRAIEWDKCVECIRAEPESISAVRERTSELERSRWRQNEALLLEPERGS